MCDAVTNRNSFQRRRDAFTLLELLVVITIIGLIAGIGIPKISGIGRANSSVTAQRQLLDDIGLARQRAIANRADIYMVFVPPGIINIDPAGLTAADARVYSNLLGGQYTSYAIVAERQVGDQPGAHTWRYLTPWRTLPEGMFIAPTKFGSATVNGVKPFQTNSIPFPTASSPLQKLPSIAFDYLGQLPTSTDEVLPLSKGSIFYHRDANGQLDRFAPDLVETPAGNSITVSNHIRVDWLTGRARVEQAQVQ